MAYGMVGQQLLQRYPGTLPSMAVPLPPVDPPVPLPPVNPVQPAGFYEDAFGGQPNPPRSLLGNAPSVIEQSPVLGEFQAPVADYPPRYLPEQYSQFSQPTAPPAQQLGPIRKLISVLRDARNRGAGFQPVPLMRRIRRRYL